jgi:PAS domain S-box-containing protein
MDFPYFYNCVLVLLYAGFASALLVLHLHEPTPFVKRFACSWFIDAARNIIMLPEIRDLRGWGNECNALNDVFSFFAAWFLFSACAGLVGIRLPRWLAPFYIGASTFLVLLGRYEAPHNLARWFGWTQPQERFALTVGNMVIVFLPLIVARFVILGWLCKLWRSTRLPGAFIAACFSVPFTLFAFVTPFQVYFSYYPTWLSFFLVFRVFGFSIGILMLLMGRQQRALKLVEQRLRAIIDQGPEGVSILAADGSLLEINPAGLRMIEADAFQEIANRPMSELVVEDQREAFRDFTERVVRGQTGILQFEMTGLKGGSHWLETHATALRDEDSRVTGLLGITRDMTENKRHIAERKRMDARFRRLVDSNVQGVMFWKVDGGITGANGAFLNIVGHTREELEAGLLDWLAMTPEKYANLDHRSLSDLAATGACAPFEKEFIRKDGSLVPVLVGAATFEDNPQEGVCFVIDLTERKNIEAQFLRAQRTEGIGTLAAGIAHDLNNMLAPVLMAVESLKIMAKEEDDLNLIEILRENTQRAAGLVMQVLSFARGVEGKRIMVNPILLLQDLLKMVRDTFPKSINVNFNPARDLWTVTGDPTQIHQVFLNLFVNARDAMPGGGTLTVTMRNITVDETYAAMHPGANLGAYVMVKVEDTGSGIPAEIAGKIFEPFFTTKEFGKGTGLGLSTSLAIVKSHGGFIHVHSEMGKGTKFEIYLPADTAEISATKFADEQPELPRGHGELILVVDDEKAIREIAHRTLEQFGYRVLLAAHGAEAVGLYSLRQSEVAAVLTDMAMPVMDGPALIVALTAINPGVRIIGSSGLESDARLADVTGANIEHFVAKPYTSAEMLRVLHTVLSAGR